MQAAQTLYARLIGLVVVEFVFGRRGVVGGACRIEILRVAFLKRAQQRAGYVASPERAPQLGLHTPIRILRVASAVDKNYLEILEKEKFFFVHVFTLTSSSIRRIE